MTHTGDFEWKDFAIQSSISAGFGAVTGGAFAYFDVLTGPLAAFVNGGADVLSQLATNAAEGEPLESGLAMAAGSGLVFGYFAGNVGSEFANRVDAAAADFRLIQARAADAYAQLPGVLRLPLNIQRSLYSLRSG